jgi:hypothetical protein
MLFSSRHNFSACLYFSKTSFWGSVDSFITASIAFFFPSISSFSFLCGSFVPSPFVPSIFSVE